uniref:Ig-like domain-containing protein n=1 Tax=Oncorhynchus tshawytscha TaxID=74940 RepID=A0AAZ3P555_ONCTS
MGGSTKYASYIFTSLTSFPPVEPQVTGYLGNDVTLRCKLLQGNLTQAEWQWEISDTEKSTIAVFSPNLGQNISGSPLKGRLEFAGASTGDSSITIKEVEMTDAGKYICLLTVFPSGSFERTTILTVLSKSGSSALILQIDCAVSEVKEVTGVLFPSQIRFHLHHLARLWELLPQPSWLQLS